MSDSVYVLTHEKAAYIRPEFHLKVKELQKKHKKQDECDLYGENEQMLGRDGEQNHENVNSIINEKTCSHENQSSSGDEKQFLEGGALWDIFRRQDRPKLEEYVKKHFKEFRHIYCNPLPQVIHPIHDQTVYLSMEQKRRLKVEYQVEPWTFVQKLGDAVFTPAGCPNQARNLKSCINAALNFVSPENVQECLNLSEERHGLPQNHDFKEDKLEVKKMILHAVNRAVRN